MQNRIAIIGIGYVGLPLLEAFGTNKSNTVLGYDISEDRVIQVRHILDKEGKNFQVTTNPKDLLSANVYIITVPTPIDANYKPDITCLKEACQIVASAIKSNDMVVFESTVYPGMTEDVCIPIIEALSGLRAGADFCYGYSPERINVGDSCHNISNTTKIVAGCDVTTTENIAEIYGSIPNLKVEKVASIKVAEAAKLMENTQRDILIAFANEYAEFCSKVGISIYDVINAASTKWNFAQVYPGLVGGHCIGVDPYYLLQKSEDLGVSMPLVSQARHINEAKASKVAKRFVERIRSLEKENAIMTILILGFSYKKNCADIRNTKVVDLVRGLECYGYHVYVCDPLVDKVQTEKQYNIQMITVEELVNTAYQAVLEVVHHDIFDNMLLNSTSLSKHFKIEQFL